MKTKYNFTIDKIYTKAGNQFKFRGYISDNRYHFWILNDGIWSNIAFNEADNFLSELK